MELPKLPTDNFYIFLTLLSGALMFYCIKNVVENEVELNNLTESVENKIDFTEQMEFHNKKSINFYDSIRNIIGEKSDTTSDTSFKAVLDKTYFQLADSVKIKNNQIMDATTETIYEIMRLQNKLEASKSKFRTNLIFACLASFGFLSGLIFWYQKHQVIQDEMLKLQRDKLKKEVEGIEDPKSEPIY